MNEVPKTKKLEASEAFKQVLNGVCQQKLKPKDLKSLSFSLMKADECSKYQKMAQK